MNENKSSRYHRYRRRAEGLAVVASACVLVGALSSGFSLWLSDASRHMAGGPGIPQAVTAFLVIAVCGLTLSVLVDTVALPFLIYSRYLLEERYRSVRFGLIPWLVGYARAMALHVVVWVLVAAGVYGIMARWPDGWWVVAGVAFAPLAIIMTHLGPIIVLPRLYDLRPLDRPSLHARLGALTRKLGTSVVAIQEWRPGPEVTRPNAALVGLGTTRRVLLSDALLADYSDDEIEVVLAHELAHHVHHDIWKTIASETVMAVVAFGAADLVMEWVASGSHVAGVDDVAGLPLLAVVAGSVALLLTPVRNGMSRRHERRADQYALEATDNPEAMVSSLRRLGQQNLAEERPSRLVAWLFLSHPPLVERVAAAQAARENAEV